MHAGVGTIQVHQGFYQGARRHLAEIQALVAASLHGDGKRLPVCYITAQLETIVHKSPSQRTAVRPQASLPGPYTELTH